MEIINKKDLAYFLADKYKFKKYQAENFVESLFLKIEQELRKENKVNIVGFGSFYTHEMPERIATNPQTGETFNLERRIVIKFKAGKKTKNMFKSKKKEKK